MKVPSSKAGSTSAKKLPTAPDTSGGKAAGARPKRSGGAGRGAQKQAVANASRSQRTSGTIKKPKK